MAKIPMKLMESRIIIQVPFEGKEIRFDKGKRITNIGSSFWDGSLEEREEFEFVHLHFHAIIDEGNSKGGRESESKESEKAEFDDKLKIISDSAIEICICHVGVEFGLVFDFLIDENKRVNVSPLQLFLLDD